MIRIKKNLYLIYFLLELIECYCVWVIIIVKELFYYVDFFINYN